MQRLLHFAWYNESMIKGVTGMSLRDAFRHDTIGKSTLLKLLLGVYRPQKGGLFLRYRDGRKKTLDRVIIPGSSEPPVRTLRATDSGVSEPLCDFKTEIPLYCTGTLRRDYR